MSVTIPHGAVPKALLRQVPRPGGREHRSGADRPGLLQVPDVLGETPSSWAMPCVPAAGIQAGIFIVPPIGSQVWVEFEQGDPDYPIWTGGFWGLAADVPTFAIAPPAIPPGQNIVLQTTGENMIMVSDAPPTPHRRHRLQERQRRHDRGQ